MKMRPVLLIVLLGSIFLFETSNTCDQFNFNQVIASTEATIKTRPNDSSVSWLGEIQPSNINFTELTFDWGKPKILDSKLVLCAFAVHYFRDSNELMYYVSPNDTESSIYGLEPGTKYTIYVEAIFGNPVSKMKSWEIQETTLGYGPDNSCKCNKLGTVNGDDVTGCDRYSETVKCECANPVTVDMHCDTCIFGAVWDPTLGCVLCDQCSPLGSDTSCSLTPTGSIQCHCLEGFHGRRCDACSNGYYQVEDHCSQCNCNGNEKLNKPICDNNGTCMSCMYPTTGDHCQFCLPGFIGDATQQACVRPNDTRSHNIAIAVLVSILGSILIVLLILGVRFLIRKRQQETGLKGLSAISGSTVQFSTLHEESASTTLENGYSVGALQTSPSAPNSSVA